MSRPPSSATVSPTTSRILECDRTSAVKDRQRPPSATISLAVWARSSAVDSGYGVVAIGSGASTNTTVAPALARARACDRPWPRAAPVTRATSPSCSCPLVVMMLPFLFRKPVLGARSVTRLGRDRAELAAAAPRRHQRCAAVDHDGLASDPI